MVVISSERIHGTSVAVAGRAVVMEGVSGSGKADLALRLIDRGGVLISDDGTLLVRAGTQLVARVPETIAGKLEVRGIGIVELPHVNDVPLGPVVRLSSEIARMPDRRQRRIAGVAVREVAIDPQEHSAPIKVELALRQPQATPA